MGANLIPSFPPGGGGKGGRGGKQVAVSGELSAGSCQRGAVSGELSAESAEPAGGQRGNTLKAGRETAASHSQNGNCIKAYGGGWLGGEPRLCKAAGKPCKGGWQAFSL